MINIFVEFNWKVLHFWLFDKMDYVVTFLNIIKESIFKVEFAFCNILYPIIIRDSVNYINRYILKKKIDL